jgi:hypothetical protein
MKILKLAIITTIAVVIVAVFIFKFTVNNKPTSQIQVTTQPTPTPVVNPTQMPTTTSSQYSDSLKAKVRSEFINTCHTKAKYSVAVCTCGADYLSANYSESDLAKMYLEYHNSNVVPKALEAAEKNCSQ